MWWGESSGSFSSFYKEHWCYQTRCVLVTQSCLTLCNAMGYSSPGFSIHWIFQARILEWVAIPRDQTQVSCIVGKLFTCVSCQGSPIISRLHSYLNYLLKDPTTNTIHGRLGLQHMNLGRGHNSACSICHGFQIHFKCDKKPLKSFMTKSDMISLCLERIGVILQRQKRRDQLWD